MRSTVVLLACVLAVIPVSAEAQSPAVDAGVGGQSVGANTPAGILERQAIGSTAAIRVLRDGVEMTFEVGIADRAVLYPQTRRFVLPFGAFR